MTALERAEELRVKWEEREVAAKAHLVGLTVMAREEQLDPMAGRGHLVCPVCGKGELAFSFLSEGKSYGKCTTPGCVQWNDGGQLLRGEPHECACEED